MIEVSAVQNKIKQSKLSPETESGFVELIPNLNQTFLSFLFAEAQKLGFEFVAKNLLDSLKNSLAIYQQFLAGDYARVNLHFLHALSDVKTENGWYSLPLAVEIESFFYKQKGLGSSRPIEGLILFETKYFVKLPDVVILKILERDIVFWLKNGIYISLLFAKLAYDRFWQNDKDKFHNFLSVLETNKSNVAQNITVEQIIKEFKAQGLSSETGQGAFAISRFITNFKKLDSESTKTIEGILKLFLWFENPELNENDIFDSDYNEKDPLSNSPLKELLGDQSLSDDVFVKKNETDLKQIKNPGINLGQIEEKLSLLRKKAQDKNRQNI